MKAKKKKKKKKLNFFKLILLLLVLYTLGYLVYFLFDLPIKNIRIFNNNIIGNDQLIIEQAKIDDYHSFLLTTKNSINKKLLENPFIKEIRIEKKWFCRLEIYITENNVLFYDKNNEVYVLEDNKQVTSAENIYGVPVLLNAVPSNIHDKFIEKMAAVEEDVKMRISEIEYKPIEVDQERFLLTLNDGNYVYLTLYTFEKINEYNKILPTLENKKGILYLDSGNYFDIFD